MANHREIDENRMSLPEFFRQFPTDETAETWFEKQRWGGHVACPFCGSMDERISVAMNRNPTAARTAGSTFP